MGNIVFLIPILGILLGFFGVWTSHKQKLAKFEMQARTQRTDDGQAARIEELEDRMRVLERIVTDGGYDLAHKIEALRDERDLDARLATPAARGRV